MSSVRLAVCALLVAATLSAQSAQVFQSAPPTLFEGARLIVDARRPPIENSAFVVANGRIVSAQRLRAALAGRGRAGEGDICRDGAQPGVCWSASAWRSALPDRWRRRPCCRRICSTRSRPIR